MCVQLSLPPYLGGKMSLCCILSEKLTSLYQSDWRRETARCWLGRRLHVWSSAHRCWSVLPGLPACTIPSHAKLKTDCHKGSVSSTSKKLSSGCWEIQKQPTIMCSDDHIHLLGTRTEHRNTNFMNFHALERFVFVFICNPTSRNQHRLIQRFVTFCVLHRAYASSNVLDRFLG